jgi:hypothetical protein
MTKKLKFQMRVFITAGVTVKNSLSANNGNTNRAEEFGNIFRDCTGTIFSIVQNGNFDELVRFQRIGKSFQKIVGNTALTDLGDGRERGRQRAELTSLFTGNIFVGDYHDVFLFMMLYFRLMAMTAFAVITQPLVAFFEKKISWSSAPYLGRTPRPAPRKE